MKYYLKMILQRMIVLALFPLRCLPIHPRRILFLTLEGGSRCEYSCNPRYLCEHILKDPDADCQIVWLFRHPEEYSFLKEQGIRTARHFSLMGFYYCLTSRIVVTNGGYLTWFPFRSGQIRINTWHGGGAYKMLENDRATANAATAKRMNFCSGNTQLFLSSSKLFTRYAVRGAFLYKGPVMECGMPRNDVFFGEEKDRLYAEIRSQLKFSPHVRLALYAPTFRDYAAELPPLPAEALLATLTERTGEEWILLTRMHRDARAASGIPENDRCLDISDYPDTQQLLCACDLLITDYSSIVWDYCLLDRPLFLYTPDLARYTRSQGFYRTPDQWGFPLCETPEEILAEAAVLDRTKAADACRYHRELLGACETGHSCESLWQWIQKNM